MVAYAEAERGVSVSRVPLLDIVAQVWGRKWGSLGRPLGPEGESY